MTLLDGMSNALQVPANYLRSLASRASHEYRGYNVAKRSGGIRLIHHPSKELKGVQRWLVGTVINKWPVHSAAAAYRPGASIYTHASLHAPYRFLLRLDMKEFFPSITASDIDTYLNRSPALSVKWFDEDRQLFTKFVTLNGHLTIGAPSSPALSNTMCFDLDAQLAEMSGSRDVVYSRYADDLFFSTNARDVLRGFPPLVGETLRNLSCPARLQLNPAKTLHRSRAQRRVVTGIVLAPDGRALLGRDVKRKIRALIHRFGTLNNDQRQSLAGLIAYAIGIDPDFLNALILKYGVAKITLARTADFTRLTFR